MAHLSHNKKIEIQIVKTTGGSFTVTVENDITVENLKKIVSKKLKISKDRICLMNSERELQDGTLSGNGIVNGSKIILTPNVETGLAQRNADSSVLQALESLNDNQVNDFLSGKSPLNLSVRLGDHLMMIQLQLSTLSPSQQNSLKQKVMNGATLKQAVNRSIINCGEPSTSSSSLMSLNGYKRTNNSSDDNGAPEKQRTRMDDETKSPIKSLSSMVSSPINTTVQSMNHNFYKSPLSPSSSSSNNSSQQPQIVDPISANLTSCLCKRLSISCNNNCEQRPSTSITTSVAPNNDYELIQQHKPTPRLIPFHQRPIANTNNSPSNSSVIIKPKQFQPSTPPPPPQQQQQQQSKTDISNDTQLLNIDNPALAEASRNLTQTLRKLSKRVFTSKAHIMDNSVINRNLTSSSSSSSSTTQSTSSNSSSTSNGSSNQLISGSSSSGAVIESMKHHGKGIYSGTFSGTLNPALQDKNGRPKRDISTIIHILNDLLSATPNCTKNGTKIFFEPTQPSSNMQSNSSNTKYIKIKKQSSSRTCTRCIPSVQKCAYGQCNGHSKTEMTSSSQHGSHNFSDFPSTSSGITRNDCSECYQTMMNQKLEMENMKTKSKLDQLKLVMQQKKERREARKLQIAPYNNTAQHIPSPSANISTITTTTPVPAHVSPSSSNSVNGNNLNRMNSDASATAITISSENHMEEVDTVA